MSFVPSGPLLLTSYRKTWDLCWWKELKCFRGDFIPFANDEVALKNQVDELLGKIDVLEERTESLSTAQSALSAKQAVLESEQTKLQNAHDTLEKKMYLLQAAPETFHVLRAREAMRTLEKYVVADVLGSRNQMRKQKICDFEDLNRSGKQSELDAKLSRQLQNVLRFYKKQGGDIHGVKYTKQELEIAFTYDAPTQSFVSSEDIGDELTLITMLESYCRNDKKAFGEF